MLLNTDTLAPMNRGSIGPPGRSFTFEVAQMNGIPLELIEEAKGKLDKNRVKMDRLLSELQKEKTYLERLTHEHIEAQELAEDARQTFLERKDKLEERLKSQQDFIDRNNVYLNAGKKMKAFIDRYQTRTRKKDANNLLLEDVRKYLLMEKSKIEEAKRKTELMKPTPVKVVKARQKKQAKEDDQYHREKIVVGSTVKMIETRQSGTVEEINGAILTVVFGFMRLKVTRDKLMWVK